LSLHKDKIPLLAKQHLTHGIGYFFPRLPWCEGNFTNGIDDAVTPV
jgi:hypothetical protein